MDLYGVLGVDAASSKQDITAAYKEKAKSLHPDKGGDASEFQKLVVAYQTLKDADKRKLYDDYNIVDGIVGDTVQVMSEQMIHQLLVGVLESCGDLDYTDILDIMRRIVSDNLGKINKRLKGLTKKIDRFEKSIASLRKRLSGGKKWKGVSLFTTPLERMILQLKKEVGLVNQEKLLWENIKEVLSSYKYEVQTKEESITYSSFSVWP